jgi:hypothetical protein
MYDALCTFSWQALGPCGQSGFMSRFAPNGAAHSNGKTGGGSRVRPVYCLAIWNPCRQLKPLPVLHRDGSEEDGHG